MKKYKVALCRFPGSGWERHECVSWLMRTLHEMKMDSQIEGVLEVVKCDTPITMTRNAAVIDAQRAGCDYILMVDSDMYPDILLNRDPLARPTWKTMWDFMMNRREEEEAYYEEVFQGYGGGPQTSKEGVRHVVAEKFGPATIAVPYCGPPPFEEPYVLRWKTFETDDPNRFFKLEMMSREEAAERAGIEKIDGALATGLILYDARVFDELPTPHFCYEYGDAAESIKASTEDVFQTRNGGLYSPELPLFVAWPCWAGHVKTKTVTKPMLITRGQVHKTLVDSYNKTRARGERINMVHPHDHARNPVQALDQTQADIRVPEIMI